MRFSPINPRNIYSYDIEQLYDNPQILTVSDISVDASLNHMYLEHAAAPGDILPLNGSKKYMLTRVMPDKSIPSDSKHTIPPYPVYTFFPYYEADILVPA